MAYPDQIATQSHSPTQSQGEVNCNGPCTGISIIAVAIASIVMGAIWKSEDCSQKLAIWLIVNGSVGLATGILLVVGHVTGEKNSDGSVKMNPVVAAIAGILSLFHVAWCSYGAALLARTSKDECFPPLYKGALACVILYFIQFGLVVVLLLCVLCCVGAAAAAS